VERSFKGAHCAALQGVSIHAARVKLHDTEGVRGAVVPNRVNAWIALDLSNALLDDIKGGGIGFEQGLSDPDPRPPLSIHDHKPFHLCALAFR
jgi:hypothetical protein